MIHLFIWLVQRYPRESMVCICIEHMRFRLLHLHLSLRRTKTISRVSNNNETLSVKLQDAPLFSIQQQQLA